jgi:hypothetical protein
MKAAALVIILRHLEGIVAALKAVLKEQEGQA